MSDNEQIFNEFKNKFGDKYKVELNKGGIGIKMFATGQTMDYISIVKNVYHGVRIAVTPVDANIDYQTIAVTSYIPNFLVNQAIGESLVARIIWGSGNDFYDSIDDFIMSEYEAESVDVSITNTAKQMLKGKSVLDD